MKPEPMTQAKVDQTFADAVSAAMSGGADIARAEIQRLSKRLQRGETHPGMTELDCIERIHKALDSGDADAIGKVRKRCGDELFQRVQNARGSSTEGTGD